MLIVDTEEYDAAWEISLEDASRKIYGTEYPHDKEMLPADNPSVSPTTKILDLRAPEDFDKGHLPGSISSPLANLTATSPIPFDDPEALQSQWKDLVRKVAGEDFRQTIGDDKKPLVVVCYNGETARLATSLMRSRGIEAYSIAGGARAMVV
jgi:cysteine synthase A